MHVDPLVYVVLLNWNGVSETLECLASLRNQDHASIKIVVVDNASMNDEASIIEREYPEVTVLRQRANLGFCGGNNVAIKYALANDADYVLVLNNDTLVPPQLVMELVRESQRLPSVGAVSPVILCYPDTSLIWYAGSEWEAETAAFRHLMIYQAREGLHAHEPYETEYACGCCLLISAPVLHQIGLMDERYFAYYDEADWASRMRNAGLGCYVIPTSVVYHKVSKATPRLLEIYFMARNRLLWMKEHLSLRERARSYPYLVKETVWNLCNVLGLPRTRHPLSKMESYVMLLAVRDFLRKSFGAAPAKVDQLARSASHSQRSQGNR